MLKRKRYLWKFVYVFVICFFCGQLWGKWRENIKQQGIDVRRKVAEAVFHIVLEQSTPIMAFMENAEIPDWTKVVWEQLNPALMCLKPEEVEKDWVQSKFIYEEMMDREEKINYNTFNNAKWDNIDYEEKHKRNCSFSGYGDTAWSKHAGSYCPLCLYRKLAG